MLSVVRLCTRRNSGAVSAARAPSNHRYRYGYPSVLCRLLTFNAMDETIADLLTNRHPSWRQQIKLSKDGNLLFENVDVNATAVNVYTFYDQKKQAYMIGVTNLLNSKEATYKIMDSTSPAWDADYIGEMPEIVERLTNETLDE